MFTTIDPMLISAYFLGRSSNRIFDNGITLSVSKNIIQNIHVTYCGWFLNSRKLVTGCLKTNRIAVNSIVDTITETPSVLYNFFGSALCANLKKLVSSP